MAGIGFDLRRVLRADAGFLTKVRIWASAGLIASGPWIVTMLSLWLVTLGAGTLLVGGETARFLALVTYAFAFSLIVVGAAQMAFTRRLADLLYGSTYGDVLPAFATAMAATGAVQVALGAGFCALAGLEARLAVVWTILYVVVSMTWTAMIWLTLVRNHERVLGAFLLGMAVSWLTMPAVGERLGVAGRIGAFTAGQTLTLTLLIGLILRGTEAAGARSASILRAQREQRALVAAGLLYALGIWVDKLVFWAQAGVSAGPWLRYHPIYDSCCFLAYLTIVPALALNLVHLETAFYERYRAYFGAILAGHPLRVIVERRREMAAELRSGGIALLRVQGLLSILCIVFAPALIELVELPEFAIRVFRLTCLGALFQVLLLIVVLIQLYFDLRREAVISTAAFCALNGIGAAWSVALGRETYGAGYALAALAALLIAFVLLVRALETLEMRTFVKQVRAHGA
jgi:uncharacterized membrane protein